MTQYRRLEAAPHWHMGKHITKWLMMLLVNGKSGCVHTWRLNDITLNICWN